MQKRYIVRLSEEERLQLREVIKKLKGSSQKVRRAQILLKSDIEIVDYISHETVRRTLKKWHDESQA